jgi:uncharacterized protein (TIGR02147 family)
MPMDGSEVTRYQDFRKFLHDLYDKRKSDLGRYSFRQFSEDLGFKPTNYVHLVVKGQRNFSLDAINKIKTNLKWTAQQKKYFHNLVLLNQATDEDEKAKYLNELAKVTGKKRAVINPDQYNYFSNWYIPVLREIVSLKGFVSNLNWMSKKLRPRVEEDLIKKALGILERLNMIKRIKNRWVQNEEHLTTEQEVTSEMVFNYHKSMLNLSLHAIDHASTQRDISAMTMSLSAKQFEWLKQRLIDFRDEIQQELQDMQDDPSIVGQLNIQLFQVTEE